MGNHSLPSQDGRSLGSSLNSIGEEIDQSWRTRLKKTMDSLDDDGRNLRQSRFRAAPDVRSDGRGRPREASFTVEPILISKKRSSSRQNKKANRPLSSSMFSTTTSETTQVHENTVAKNRLVMQNTVYVLDVKNKR